MDDDDLREQILSLEVQIEELAETVESCRKWVNMALTPTGLQSPYGFINYFLNTDRKQWPSAPSTAFMHNGNGLNMVYVDPENDLVAVVRWIDNNAVDGFLKRLIAAVAEKS
jgi:CubicO group peptidase (beta-lactamase class C family)